MDTHSKTAESTGDLPILSFATEPPPGALWVPLSRIIEEAAGFLDYGGPRSGKTHAVRQFLEETHGRIQHIVFDSEGEFYTLREAFPYLLAARTDGDIPLSVATAGVLCARVMELGVSLICDISGLTIDERPAYIAAFLTQLLETPKELWHPVVIAVDEVHRFAPQDGAAVSKSLLANLPAIGRKRGFIAFYATQNIEQVDKDVIAYLPNKMVGKITMDNRRKRAADDFGLSNADRERLKTMKRGQFFAQGVYSPGGEAVLLQVPDTQTHPPVMGAAGWKNAPPTPDAIKELLAHFAALPDEAAAEVKSLDHAKMRIADLEKQIAAKDKRGTTPAAKVEYRDRIVEKRVEVPVEVYVEVPIFRQGEAERLLQVADNMAAIAKDLMAVGGEIKAALHQSEAVKGGKAAEAKPTSEAATVPAPKPEKHEAKVDETKAKPLTGKLTGPQQKILNALATFDRLGRAQTERTLVAVWSGYSASGGAFKNYLGELRGLGLISYLAGDRVSLTEAGQNAAQLDLPPLDSVETLHRAWYSRMTGPQKKLLQELVATYPQGMPRSTLAAKTGYEPTGGAFKNYMGELRTLGAATFPDSSTIKATALMFPAELVGKG